MSIALPKRKELDGPTPEQLASAKEQRQPYTRSFTTHVETATISRTYRSNHDPVMRWIASGKLSETQQAAIGYVRRLWELSGLRQAVTANYGHVAAGAGCAERRALLEIEAREDLHRCQDYVPSAYWSVFEMVCRFGETAVAGALLQQGSARSNDARAHTVVCFVADIVAMKECL